MGETLAQKIIRAHLLHGDMTPGSEIALRIDQTLTQDATGTMAYLEFETMGIPRVKTELSVAYVDHNTLQSGFENADDHRYLQTVAAKHGVWFSRPGNGICHQVHLERFGKPGKTLIGSDSHTPTGGGIGMLAFGAGGMDVAVAMGGGAYYITMPKMFKVNLTGTLRPFVTAKDISLVSFFLIGKGMIWGNVIGIVLCLVQSYFRVVKLDPSVYYLDAVPIDLTVFSIVLLNIGTLAAAMLMMLGPSYLITKIHPAKSIRFE